MRLLKLVGNEFSFVQVPTHNNLPYAILSHTWTPGQEITYQELVSGSGKGKSGFEKIKFCGKQAMNDGLLYFWVDTCCINKSDPAELTTAINSMFRWYRNAVKCYVYLADVSIPNSNSDALVHQGTWENAFRSSKWFSRGWTLQELIAPTIVEFYSKEGRQLCNKRSREELIHEITRIPIKALQGSSLSGFSITERKNWAAQRQTTQEEDLVYCLLGLCEVSMPAIYGEGKEAALKRFQMTVKGFSSSSQPEDAKPNIVHFIVPFDRNPNFTGREPQLTKLKEQFFSRGQTAKVAITGLGGIGKTQLVLELAYQVREKHENCSVIWIPATNMESLEQAYLDAAQKLGIPGWADKKANIKRIMQDHLSKESAGEWLLVFDNADDIDMWIPRDGSRQDSNHLIEFLPRSKQGSIVFTTRDRKAAVELAHQNVVEVLEMDEQMSTHLLRKYLINKDLIVKDIKALLAQLTYLPLAIVQAAAYINKNRTPLARYLLLLNEQEGEVIEILSKDFGDEGRYRNVKNPVATTWLISFKQIQDRDPLAAEYLSFMACVNPKDIPQSLLPPGLSRTKETDAIGTLDGYSFIIRRSTDGSLGSLDMHRLVHLATRNWLRRKQLIVHWTERAITRLKEVFPDADHANRSLWRAYLPHVQCVLISEIVDKEGASRMELVWRFGMSLLSDGRYNEAEVQFREALEADRRVLGAEHPDTLTSMGNLASTYRNQGRWKEAEDLEVQVIETRKRMQGVKHPSTLISMGNLALTYRNQGRWKEAEDLGVQVIEIMKKVLGTKHPHMLVSMANLASIMCNQGRWKEAEDLEVQVMETSKRVLGAEHPDTLISMANLASTYQNQGRWKEAEDLEVQVVETSKRVLGAEHPDTLTSMANLAFMWRQQGRLQEALELLEECVELQGQVLGIEHPHSVTGSRALLKWRAEAQSLGVT